MGLAHSPADEGATEQVGWRDVAVAEKPKTPRARMRRNTISSIASGRIIQIQQDLLNGLCPTPLKAHGTAKRRVWRSYFASARGRRDLTGLKLDAATIVAACCTNTIEDTGRRRRDEPCLGSRVGALVEGFSPSDAMELVRPTPSRPRTAQALSLSPTTLRVLCQARADRRHNMRTLEFVRTLARACREKAGI